MMGSRCLSACFLVWKRCNCLVLGQFLSVGLPVALLLNARKVNERHLNFREIIGRLIPAGTGNPDNKNIVVNNAEDSSEKNISKESILEEKVEE